MSIFFHEYKTNFEEAVPTNLLSPIVWST